jgi:hypothetical protein
VNVCDCGGQLQEYALGDVEWEAAFLQYGIECPPRQVLNQHARVTLIVSVELQNVWV